MAWRRPPVFRVRLGMLALTLAMVPTAVVAAVGSVPAMALVLLVGGLAIAPTLIATLSMAEQAAPTDRLTEAGRRAHRADRRGGARRRDRRRS